jgi:hypothetical protein
MARISRDEYAKASGVFGLAPGGVQKQEDLERFLTSRADCAGTSWRAHGPATGGGAARS